MYKLIVQATTMPMLKAKLQEAADAIGETESSTEGVDLGYEGSEAPARQTGPTVELAPSAQDDTQLSKQIIQEVSTQPPAAPAPPMAAPQVIQTQTQPASNGTVDSKGMPWDERIHSITRNFNKDGSWRYRRGTTDEEIANVENQTRAAMAGGTSPHQAVPHTTNLVLDPTQLAGVPASVLGSNGFSVPSFSQPPAPVAPSVPQGYAAPPVPFQPQVVQPVAAPVQAAPQVSNQKPAHDYASFKQNLVETLGELVAQGSLNQAWIEGLKQNWGLKEIWNILGSEAQCVQLFDYLVSNELITKIGR